MEPQEKSLRFVSYWPALLLVGFASSFISLVPLLGYRWSVELALAVFLMITACGSLIFAPTTLSLSTSKGDFRLISLPLVLFVSWSFLSALWATSPRSAIHHSLLWSCYLIFYIFVKQAAEDEEIRNRMMNIVAIVAFAIAAACVVEYFGVAEAARKTFNERYYSYAEVFVALIPVFISVKLVSERNTSRLALGAALMSWAMVVATTSRTMLVAGSIGIAVFVVFALLVYGRVERPRRLIVTVITLVAITLLLQIPFRSGEYSSTFTRLAEADDSSARSSQSRRVMWGLAVEGFVLSPIVGIGSDNYFADYKTLRESFSDRDPENPLLEVGEEFIPERAHNEYLQIFAELGVVGGLLVSWLLVGIGYMFWLAFKRKASLLTLGALSGIVAFLAASGASSYSFRFPTNGICFFFLLALASRELFVSPEDDSPSRANKLGPILGIIVSVAMIAFCFVRVNSIRHLTNATLAKDDETRTAEFENAISIDPSEPMFRFYYGQWLAREEAYNNAAEQLRIAIDNGLANSSTYFRLAVAEQRGGRSNDAETTFQEALRVFPRSVFLRTAYASFLKSKGEHATADAEYQASLRINEKQARSWQLAHEEGLERLVQVSRVDSSYVSPFDLLPSDGPLALTQ